MPGWQRRRPVVPQGVDIAERLEEMDAERDEIEAMLEDFYYEDLFDFYDPLFDEPIDPYGSWDEEDEFYRGHRDSYGDPGFDAFDPFDDFFDYGPDPFGLYEDTSWGR